MTRTYQEVYVRAFFISSVVGGWELPLFMVQILTHPKRYIIPFSHPEPVHISVGGDIAGRSQVDVHKAVNSWTSFPFWYFTNEVCFKYQHLMISPRLPSVKKELTERSVLCIYMNLIYVI